MVERRKLTQKRIKDRKEKKNNIKLSKNLNFKDKSLKYKHTKNNYKLNNKKVYNKKSKKYQIAGSGQGNQGHDVSLPIQYFGQKLNRYFPTGSTELIPPTSSYGPIIATSHGVSIPGNNQFVGPNLAPFNQAIGISGIQTGGIKRRKLKGGNLMQVHNTGSTDNNLPNSSTMSSPDNQSNSSNEDNKSNSIVSEDIS